MLLHDAIDLFINRPEIAPATRRTYGYDLRRLANYIGPERPLSDIHATDILRFMQSLDNDPVIKSNITYNKYVTSVKALFRFCHNLNLIGENPAQLVKKKKTSRRVPDGKAMPRLKLLRLLDYVAETPRGWNPREEALIRFLADTGARIGSAGSLTEDRLDIQQHCALIEMKNLPDGDYHKVFFGRECAYALSTWLLQRTTSAGHYVFSTDGHKMTNRSLGQYFRRLCQRAGIGSWGPHSLRHAYALKGLEAFPPSVVAQLLGDTVEVLMQAYGKQTDAQVEQAARLMVTDHLTSVPLELLKKEDSK